MQQHFILCGLGRVGWRVLDYLQAAGMAVAVIDNRCPADDPRLKGVPLVSGDCRRPEVLEKAGLAQARGVLILTSEDLVSISTALMVRHLNPTVRVVVRMFNQGLIARLGKTVENIFALSTSALVAPLLALIARTGEALGTFRLEDGRRWQVVELAVRPGSPQDGRTVADLATGHAVQVVAHLPATGGQRFLPEVNPGERLAPGDRLVVCGEPDQVRPLLARADHESLPELLWAGFIRRQGRMVLRTLAEVDPAVKICTAVLVAVIAGSVLVFRYGMRNDTLADAFYRTISLMATGADMRGGDLEPGAWQKVFISGLRLVGMALTAVFTAIITNYLVRAHLRGALEVRRIPESGHVIVCGLGNVGYRVVEELVHQGERVVALERSRDNAFIPTARRRGVAVILGDATIPEVLRQAHAGTARAVVAATSNELVNLEIALLVRELNPQQRVVLRLTDPNLARTLREAADVRLALSIPELAAPAFVAALFGDRVRSVFLVQGRLLAVVDLVAQARDQFLLGQSVRALAVDYRLLPVRLVGADGKSHPQPLQARLGEGDCLTAILALGDLQRLLQRENVPHTFSVEVTELPPGARGVVAQLLRSAQALSAEEAEERLRRVPVCLGRHLTRGQAEDLLYLLNRERVTARLSSGDGV